MTKVCICQICTCGRHRCPHNPKPVVNKGNGPCTVSEYANVFKAKPFEPVQSFKPSQNLIQNQGTMASETTNKYDYTKHALPPRVVRQPETYQKSENKMEGVTSYKKEYEEKPLPERKQVKPPSGRKTLGEFKGEPTYRGDFQAWKIERTAPINHGPSYRPNSAPFCGETGYDREFKHQPFAVRQSMKPQEQTTWSKDPFISDTSYKNEYTRKCVTPPQRTQKIAFKMNQIPFEGQTRYNEDFTEKATSKVSTCKPDGGAYRSDAPFQDETTTRKDYGEKPIQARFKRKSDIYKKPDGQMENTTTTHHDFNKKPMQLVTAVKPIEHKGVPGKFSDETTNRVDYPKQPYQAQHVIKLAEYCPPEGQFEGMSTCKRDYIKHPLQFVPSMKPQESSKTSTEPFANSTGYREQYTEKPIERVVMKATPVWTKNQTKFDSSTNYKNDFIEKTVEKRLPCKPSQASYQTDAPFSGETTNKKDFTTLPIQKRYIHEAPSYIPPTGEMASITTTKTDFCQKPIERIMARQPPSSNRAPGKFYSDTTHKLDFTKKESNPVKRVGPRNEYVKVDAYFEGQSSYASEYQKKDISVRQSLRPNEAPISSGAQFDDTTMYQREFKNRITVCPAMLLKREGLQNSYKPLGAGPTGHQFYEKVFTPQTAV